MKYVNQFFRLLSHTFNCFFENTLSLISNTFYKLFSYPWKLLFITSSQYFSTVNKNVRRRNYKILLYLNEKNVPVNLNRSYIVKWYKMSGYKWTLPRLLLKKIVLYYEVTKLIPTIFSSFYNKIVPYVKEAWKVTLSEGPTSLLFIAGVLFGDFIFSDDEPLWEPVEWSFVQTWILFIFMFAWIGENLIGSKFGGYTGRDKRVWLSWYKTYWFVELGYVVSLGAASLFVIIPFYHELNYTTPFVFLWWDWYVRVFFFKSTALFSILMVLATYLTTAVSYSTWKKSMLIIIMINLLLIYLAYTHFIMAFFAYFTDPNWYHQTRLIDYVKISHEPNKWSWGPIRRDHFSYHKSSTVFWYKNDGPFAASMMFFHVMYFLSLFTVLLYWIALARRVYSTQEVTYTYLTYCVSLLRQFAYLLVFFYLLIFYSYLVMYWRLPLEYYSLSDSSSWLGNFFETLVEYPKFLYQIIFNY